MSMKFSHVVSENCRSEGKDNASRGHMVLIGMDAGTKKKKKKVRWRRDALVRVLI